ncbi:YaaR family protein [Bacillus sp. FJAT-47783]|uniref:YaaR family protein n=1 Tax=Bacillus sp. FJAT-47783 TaxID=2922712 RepID=UPI001FAD1FE4|nr:YaaR family protein [Bacillus sp. FJAT-47783]
MKVSELLLPQASKREIKQNKTSTSTRPFHELVQKQESKLYNDQLNKLMTELERAGSRLHRSMNVHDLSTFKTIVKRFIREAVEYGMSLKESNNWDLNGNKRTLHLVEEIDQKLVELTDELLTKEKEGVNILGKIGEIKGLLINLYT